MKKNLKIDKLWFGAWFQDRPYQIVGIPSLGIDTFSPLTSSVVRQSLFHRLCDTLRGRLVGFYLTDVTLLAILSLQN